MKTVSTLPRLPGQSPSPAPSRLEGSQLSLMHAENCPVLINFSGKYVVLLHFYKEVNLRIHIITL